MAIEDNPQVQFHGYLKVTRGRGKNAQEVFIPTSMIKMENGMLVDLTRRAVSLELVGVTGVELIPEETVK